jgi:hypothetical protein
MFTQTLSAIEGVFASSAWTANNIKSIPANFEGDMSSVKEYVHLSVLPANSSILSYGVQKQLNGLVAVKIFVTAGYGQRRLMEIGDLLDNVLQYKTLSNGTRLDSSYINVEGLDPRNESFYSGSYFIPFTLYGEN